MTYAIPSQSLESFTTYLSSKVIKGGTTGKISLGACINLVGLANKI